MKTKDLLAIQLYRILLFTAVFYVAANLGKTSVKFWHVASLLMEERSVNLQIGHGKTLVKGSIVSGGTVNTL